MTESRNDTQGDDQRNKPQRSAESQSQKHSARSLWRNADYRWWWGADTSFALSGSLLGFVLPLLVLAATGATAAATGVNAVTMAVAGALMLVGGMLQDTFDRRRLLMIQGLMGFVIYGAIAGLYQANMLGLPVLMVIAVLLGVRSGLFGGTTNSMLRGVVADEDLPIAISLNNGRDAAIEVAGGPLGGLLMGISKALPVWACMVLNGIATLCSFGIHNYWKKSDGGKPGDNTSDNEPSERAANANADKDTKASHPVHRYVSDALAGLRWLLTTRFNRHTLVPSAVGFGCFNALITLSILDIVQQGKGALSAGFIYSSIGIGMFFGSLVSAKIVSHVPTGVIAMVAFAVMTVTAVGITLAPNAWMRFLFLLVCMALLPAGNASMGGFQAILVSKSAQGRVNAGLGTIEMIVSPVIVALSGVFMQWFGYRTAGVILSIVTLLSVLYGFSMKAVRAIPKPDGWHAFVEEYRIPTLGQES
ncbi:MFS transporter [Bifidobacterium jacchi]|uniref:MFS transporter n=1 Tax=Bifidobacterium jacchi TaxID=2490545 RepID=A0A5N5RMF9_9BIFI|nr:MFS transporter [Bifidobacterium jacchi]KAB5608130.1 MFS transporter [Bifidobacterium jacchi]